MRKNRLFSLVLITLAAAPLITNAQVPILYYDFSTGAATNGATVDNLIAGPDGILQFGTSGGTVAYNNTGTIPGLGSVSGPQFLGRTLTFTPAADANANLQAPNINTNFTALALGITPSAAYTAMAWVNFASTAGDNMIFGQAQLPAPTDQVLHHGSRNGNYHSGHWADDRGPDQSVFVTTGTSVWHHVAYTNDVAGTQKMFVDGVEIDSGATGTAGQMVLTQNILIGTSGNAGSFSGQLDEIKVFNSELTEAQIQAAARVIPEPSSVALLALSGLGIGFMRRRCTPAA